MEQYENKIQHYEQLYQQELTAFKSQLVQTSSSEQKDHIDMIMILLNKYLNHHTKRWIHQIRFKESCLHTKLVRHYRRHVSQSTNKIIDVYPQIIVDVPKVSLNPIQLDYLSRNGSISKNFPLLDLKLFINYKLFIFCF